MTLFDSHMPPPTDLHCHLGEAGGYETIEGEALVLAVTNDPSAWRRLHQSSNRRVTWALGLHPRLLRQDDERLEALLEGMPRALAVGEVGLDYSPGAMADRSFQREALSRILAEHSIRSRLVSIHSLKATTDVVSLLEDSRVPGAILHWFLGSNSDLQRALALDVYFSVNQAMLNSRRGRAVLSELPPNRVLTETDAPYISGRRRSQIKPGGVSSVEAGLARIWEIDPTEVRLRVWRNLKAQQDRIAVKTFGRSLDQPDL